MKKCIFLYPITKEEIKEQNNNYIRQLILHLSKEFKIVNGVTKIGLLDALIKIRKTDIYYFNWIEDVPTKSFGFIQVILLILLLFLCKVFNKKVIWFIHNNVSHDKKYYLVKRLIVRVMSIFSDLILSHSREIKLDIPKNKLKIFHHPIEDYKPISIVQPCKYDLIIWGGIFPYKGVAEFVNFTSTSQYLKSYKILIAGKFYSDEFYNRIKKTKPDNITIINEFITNEQLIYLFSQSQYILFTYASSVVLSSAALCKSLSFGKEIVAPNIGSFKELGDMNLLYTYTSFQGLEVLLKDLKENKRRKVEDISLYNYIQNTSWDAFSKFLFNNINFLYSRRSNALIVSQ